ncbi:hypothetical protein BDZ94DRAFT_1331854 [Collybia nuda]|uniref:F-box domain-containing protein n=1 Tax=Collybia nuda TaxID=64659 RepID=A0A9P5XXH0_9AGAR|nr:hypothetical protein BDZ94DRAFT_1331854 [Collybia nuda]
MLLSLHPSDTIASEETNNRPGTIDGDECTRYYHIRQPASGNRSSRIEEEEHHTKVIAPYKKLPVELIRMIIRLCVPKFRGTYPYPYNVKGSLYYRLRITQICATWRRLASDEPTLWKLHINADKRHFKLAAAWFREASVFDMVIAPYGRRLKYLGLKVCKELLWDISSYLFDNIEKLYPELYQTDYNHNEPSKIEFSIPPPSLRSVSISVESWFVHETLFLGLPLKQLTKLEIFGDIPGADLVQVLLESPSLKKFTIRSIPQEQLQDLDISFDWDVKIFFKYDKGFTDERILPSVLSLVEFFICKRRFQQLTLIRTGTGDLLPLVERLEFRENDLELVFDMLATRSLSAQADPDRISQIKCGNYKEKLSKYYHKCENWRSNGIGVEITNE